MSLEQLITKYDKQIREAIEYCHPITCEGVCSQILAEAMTEAHALVNKNDDLHSVVDSEKPTFEIKSSSDVTINVSGLDRGVNFKQTGEGKVIIEY
jgi:hypothetical protein